MPRVPTHTEAKALVELRETLEMTTAIAADLGIPFELFLRYAQLPEDKAKVAVRRLLDTYVPQPVSH